MLKIERLKAESDRFPLRLEGRLIGPWVEELRRSCEPDIATGVGVTIDLTDVSFVDQAGAALLRRLKNHHAVVLNCSGFVAEQLKGWEHDHGCRGRTGAA